MPAYANSSTDGLPLSGVRVLELCRAIAGPFCGQLLGYFGADIIKIEPLRRRPSKSVRELDVERRHRLEERRGQKLVRVPADVPNPALEKWGLGPPELRLLNPSLIFTRRSLDSDPSMASWTQIPIHYLDLLFGLTSVSGTRLPGYTLLLEKHHFQSMTGREWCGLPKWAPFITNPIQSAHLMRAVGREDLIGPLYAQNHHRVARQAEIEEAISSWTSVRPAEEVLAVLEKAGVPVSRVVGVKEIMENEQVKARGAVEDVWVRGSEVKTRWAGPDLGEHTDDVLINELGLDANELARLRRDGIIGGFLLGASLIGGPGSCGCPRQQRKQNLSKIKALWFPKNYYYKYCSIQYISYTHKNAVSEKLLSLTPRDPHGLGDYHRVWKERWQPVERREARSVSIRRVPFGKSQKRTPVGCADARAQIVP
ncbi:CoA-transferase family III domain-containing protein [Melanogaster broomeanus]|nr:CoA-transferase family III domain-containing protein [Melanogaster broomeanus]